MYTQRDLQQVNAALRREWFILGPVLLVLAGAYVYALAARVRWLAMVCGSLLFVVLCYGLLARIRPLMRYRRFLRDLEQGLTRQVRGTVLQIGERAELQDGAMVLPVRLLLAEGEPSVRRESLAAERLNARTGTDDGNERILYINYSKRQAMPRVGQRATFTCFGRHIRAVTEDG